MTVALAIGLVAGIPAVGHATTDCTFTTSGTTMTLDADCTTDETIEVPDGFTLDGAGHTITAVQPPVGPFRDAVVANGGTTANVTNLTIDTDGLTRCGGSGDGDADGRDDRLRGIMLQGASGTISHVSVLNIHQGPRGCQEGNAIEVRNAPFTGAHPNTQFVTVEKSRVENYQKTGILANGDVDVTIEKNVVVGLGPTDVIGQNGIQIGFGGTGTIEKNDVSGNVYTGGSAASGGILLWEASGNSVEKNTVSDNDVGIFVNFDDGSVIAKNDVANSVDDGIRLAESTGLMVDKNKVDVAGDDGIQVGNSSSENTVEKNDVRNAGDDGIVNTGSASDNTYEKNRVKGSGDLSCNDSGSGNTWEKNKGQAPSSPAGIC